MGSSFASRTTPVTRKPVGAPDGSNHVGAGAAAVHVTHHATHHVLARLRPALERPRLIVVESAVIERPRARERVAIEIKRGCVEMHERAGRGVGWVCFNALAKATSWALDCRW